VGHQLPSDLFHAELHAQYPLPDEAAHLLGRRAPFVISEEKKFFFYFFGFFTLPVKKHIFPVFGHFQRFSDMFSCKIPIGITLGLYMHTYQKLDKNDQRPEKYVFLPEV
jgi:hypothetical protein